MIADLFHRMKYMERLGSGLRKIDWEIEKLSGYIATYNPEIFSTATDFRVILKNANYQLSQKSLVNDQVSEQDKSPDIPHTVLNLCIHLIAHGSESVQITHAHSIMGTANDKSYDATHDTTHDNLEDDAHQKIIRADMEDAGQFDQQVNGAAALSVLHAADMLLACQAQANRQFLLRNATGSANIVKSLTKLFYVKIHTFLLPHSRYRTGSTEGQKRSRMTVKKKSCADKTEHGVSHNSVSCGIRKTSPVSGSTAQL